MSKNKSQVNDSLKQLAHGAGISFIFGIIGYVLMFLTKLIVAKYFGASEYGLYEATNTVLLMAMVFALLGVPYGASRFIPFYKNKGENSLWSGYLKFIIYIPLISSLFIGIAIFMLSGKIALFFNFPKNFALFLKIVSLAIPLKAVSSTLRQIFIAEKKIFYQAFSDNFLEKIILISSILVIIFLKLSILYFIIAILITSILVFSFDLFNYKNKILTPGVAKNNYRKKEWLLFSLPLFFGGFFTFFIQWSDNLIVGKMLTPALLGIYAVAYSFGDFLGFFKSIFASIFTPIISEKSAHNLNNEISFLYKKATSWSVGIGLFVFCIFLLFGKEILNILYGSDFLEGYASLIIISIGLLIFIGTGLNDPILILHKKTSFIFKVSLWVAILNIILNIFLVSFFGIKGAAFASATSLFIRGLMTLLKARKLEKVSLDFESYLKFILAFVTTIIFIGALKIIISQNVFSIIILSILSFFLYVSLLYLMKFFKSEDKQIATLFFKKIKLM